MIKTRQLGVFKLNSKKIIGNGFEATIYLSPCNNFVIKNYKNTTLKYMRKEYNLFKNKKSEFLNTPIDIGYLNGTSDATALIYKYYRDGDLVKFDDKLKTKRIKKRCKIYEELFLNLWHGLYFCHNNNICHRDIKPENLFLKRDNNNNKNKKVIVIGDFGLSASVNNIKTRAGTMSYLAPEVALNRFYKYNPQYNYKIDIWSAGISYFRLIYGEHVFHNYKNIILESGYHGFKEYNPRLWSSLSEKSKIIFTNSLQVYPDQRWDAEKFIELY